MNRLAPTSICFLSELACTSRKRLGQAFSTTIPQGKGCETYLVDPDRLAVQLDLVHDPAGVLGILLRSELAETETLMSLRDTVLGQVDIH